MKHLQPKAAGMAGWGIALALLAGPARAGDINHLYAYHTATPLNNGQILIAGGSRTSSINEANIFDPVFHVLTPTGAMAEPRSSHTAILLPNGQVLVVGGDAGAFAAIASSTTELYDPASGRWTLTGSMAEKRAAQTATLLLNGRVLVAGGNGGYGVGQSSSTETYDPATGVWQPAGAMTKPRELHTATLLHDGRVLAIGGRPDGGSAEIFDPVSGTWSATTPVGGNYYQNVAVLLADGKVLVVSPGMVYDPASATWTPTGPMVQSTLGGTATLLRNGKVLVTGWDLSRGPAQVYDPVSNTWAATQTMLCARAGQTATLLADGRVLIFGGNSSPVAEVYDPLTNGWSVFYPVPPVVPTGVGAVSQDGGVTVSWNLTPGATSYSIYVSSTPGVTKTNATLVRRDAVSPQLINNLTNGVHYHFVVTAWNATGESGVSAEVSAAPSPAGCIYVISPSSDAAAFYYGGGAGTVNVKTASVCPWEAVSNNSWLHVTLPSGGNGTGSGTVRWTSDVTTSTGTFTIASQTFTVFPVAPPPTGFQAIASDGQVYLTWNDDFGQPSLHQYKVYGSSNPGVTHQNASIKLSAAQRTKTVTGLTNGVTYYFVVTIVYPDQNETSPTAQVSATPINGGCTYTILPTSDIAELYYGGGVGTVNVTTQAGCPWSAVSNASWLHIIAGSSGVGSGTVNWQADVNPSTGTMTLAGQTFTVVQMAPPPGGLQAVSGDGQVRLTWNPLPHGFRAYAYTVYGSAAAGVTPQNASITMSTVESSQTVTGLNNGTTYYFVVTLTVHFHDAETGPSSQVFAIPTGPSATATTVALDSVKVHPSPWRSDLHHGYNLIFDHLPADSTIKIFSLDGHWVKTLPIASGTAPWDLKNDNGSDVASGLYLYVVTSPSGKAKGKFAVIR